MFNDIQFTEIMIIYFCQYRSTPTINPSVFDVMFL